MTRVTQKCLLSVLTGAVKSGLILEKIYELLSGQTKLAVISGCPKSGVPLYLLKIYPSPKKLRRRNVVTVLIYVYKTVSLSMTSSSVKEIFSDLFWNSFSVKSPFLRQINMSRINSPTVSMPPAEKKVA